MPDPTKPKRYTSITCKAEEVASHVELYEEKGFQFVNMSTCMQGAGFGAVMVSTILFRRKDHGKR